MACTRSSTAVFSTKDSRRTRLHPLLLSDCRPPPHYSRFTGSAAGGEHLPNVHVAAEADEIVATLQISLPAVKASVVAEVVVAFQGRGKIGIMPVIDPCVTEDRRLAGPANRRLPARWRRYEAPRIGPTRRSAGSGGRLRGSNNLYPDHRLLGRSSESLHSESGIADHCRSIWT